MDEVFSIIARYFPGLPAHTAKEIAGIALLSVEYLTTIPGLRKRLLFIKARRPSAADADLLREILDEKSIELGLAAQPAEKPVATPQKTVCRKSSGAPQNRAAA